MAWANIAVPAWTRMLYRAKEVLSSATSTSLMRLLAAANESTQYARYNILVQAGTAMLSQANASPQSALRLLQ